MRYIDLTPVACFMLIGLIIYDTAEDKTRAELEKRIHTLEQIQQPCIKTEGIIDAAYRF